MTPASRAALRGCLIIAFGVLLIACSGNLSDPQKIVDRSIEVHGGDKYLHSEIEFDFRDRHYIIRREGGMFSKERIFRDAATETVDILDNNGFTRRINDQELAVPDSMVTKYSASINAVVYFALLPYALNDPSVIKTFLGTTTLEGQSYYRIQVTFGPDAGEGNQDKFYFWFHVNKFTMDYFSYYYLEDGKWDFRFRKAFKQNRVGAILFQDYINYKPGQSNQSFEQVEELYQSHKLVELSKIELKNISVK